MEKEKRGHICKIIASASILFSLLVALLPCFTLKKEVFSSVISDYDIERTDGSGSWENNSLTELLTDSESGGLVGVMDGGFTGNMIRSSVVILSGCSIYSYTRSHYFALLYFLLVLVGVPVLSLITAGFHIWGKSTGKIKLSAVFLGINLLLCISTFATIPSFFAEFIRDFLLTTLGVEMGSVLVATIQTLVFQLMLRSMSIGFWGFLLLQILALVCTMVRSIHNTDEARTVSKVIKAAGKLIGITGTYAGAEVTLEAEGIILGRDAGEAQLIIDSPKISRRHCQINFDNIKNQYVITDYSSNGTFVGRRRLTKGIAEILPIGTVIDLGDSKNSFRLQ